MIRAFRAILPAWAQPDHPLLGYELAPWRVAVSRRKRLTQLLPMALLLGGAGYLYASGSDPSNLSDWLWRGLYFPLLLLQGFCVLAGLGFGVAAIEAQRNRLSWDHLRVTAGGADLTLRMRWLAILYRFRGPLLAILLARVCLLLIMLYDLTAFGGNYLVFVTGALDPPLGALLIALIIALNLLLPLAATGLAAALGILISALVKERFFALSLQAALSILYIILAAGLLLAVTALLQGRAITEGWLAYSLALAFGAINDWGLLLTHLGSLAETLSRLPHALWLPPGLALTTLLMATLCDGLLAMAGKLAERGD